MALTLADRATVLNAGQVVYAGNTAALENADVLAQAYLGSPPQAK
jgi:ABC-type branched-subunit amino acid transport system ATPase component